MVKRGELTEEGRDTIALLKNQGVFVREIGKRLNREHSTISREIKRNRFKEIYVAIPAEKLAMDRKSEAGKRAPLKDKETYSYVVEKLGQGWSPE